MAFDRARAVASRMVSREVRAPLQPLKVWAMEYAVQRIGARSLADLGGLWAVRAGYTRHAAESLDLDRVVLVDTGIDDDIRSRTAATPNIELVTGNFGDPDVAGQVGPVDVVLFFDVLLHQVAPDWDEVFALWADRARCVVVVQPTWVASEETIRLIDLGEQEYLRVVPDEPLSRQLFGRLDDWHPGYERPWRDVHEVWQWGITQGDLNAVARRAGFRRVAHVDDGPWGQLTAFDQVASIYLAEREGR